MKRLPAELLERQALALSAEDRDEMAIPSYLHANPALRWMAWRRLEVTAARLARICADMPGGPSAIMDYGCGTGVLFAEERRHAPRVLGVDPVLAAARLYLSESDLDGLELATPDEARERVAPGSFDVVVAAEVLEHVEPLDETLEFLRASLHAEGRLLVSLPTENALYRCGRRLAGFEGHYHHANAATIDAEIARSGFRRERVVRVPGPGPLAVYWVADYRLA